MVGRGTVLTAAFWRSRRSAAVAGIIFAVLLLVAMIMLRVALADDSLQVLRSDPQRRGLLELSLNLVPFAAIAFLWFIGVVRDQLGQVEDRLFSTVFLGSGLLFVAMLFVGASTTVSVLAMLVGTNADPDVYAFARESTRAVFSVYAMRMAAVFTLSVSTVGLRTAAVPRWVCYLGYAVGLVLLTAAASFQWTQLVFPVWVLVFSLVILLHRPLSAKTEPGTDPETD